MPRKKKLDEQHEKQLLILKAQYEMHIKTLEEVTIRGKKEATERMNLIIQDDINQMKQIDEDFTNKCIDESKKKGNAGNLVDAFVSETDEGDLISRLDALDDAEGLNDNIADASQEDTKAFYEEVSDPVEDLYAMAEKIEDSFEQRVDLASEELKNEETIYNNVDPTAQYDLIKLPSKGECYKNKITKVPVGYLTAADENLITSPNLYESGSIINILLQRKVLNKGINVDSLIAGDVDAIMVFLRGTSYGNMFPIVATDPKTGEKIDTEVDLSTLHYKPFTLKGDENGFFDFTMPLTKKKIKFRFLTKGEERLLKKLNKNENAGIVSYDLNEAIIKITSALKEDTVLSDAEKNIILDAKKKLEKWAENSKKKGQNPWTKSVTNTLEMQIVSVDGETDKKAIHEYVMNMPASDSLALRRYIYDNQPGVDFKVEVKRPESKGGGSFPCFLEWDDSVFWNIA